MEDKKREMIIGLLREAYVMEVETALNFMRCGLDLEGMVAEIVKGNLAGEAAEEMGHAKLVGERIKVLGGRVPGSYEMQFDQESMQMSGGVLMFVGVVMGVIEAEGHAVAKYQELIEACKDVDPVTEGLCVELKGDEEGHLRKYQGFLAELEQSCFKKAC